MSAALSESSAVELTGAIRRREVSAREALEAHFDRIDAVNGPINAVITQDREGATALAEAADEVTMSGADLPPLHGLPMTHKDTHNTRGLRTTQGSSVFEDFVPTFDDLIITRLKGAGVVTTGKTNVPEFAAGSHTFNEVFGTTVNPYDTGRSAGGSSGGVAASIAARIQPLGDGSDMGGSFRIPASFCNVVGYRPSIGVVPSVPTRNSRARLSRVDLEDFETRVDEMSAEGRDGGPRRIGNEPTIDPGHPTRMTATARRGPTCPTHPSGGTRSGCLKEVSPHRSFFTGPLAPLLPMS